MSTELLVYVVDENRAVKEARRLLVASDETLGHFIAGFAFAHSVSVSMGATAVGASSKPFRWTRAFASSLIDDGQRAIFVDGAGVIVGPVGGSRRLLFRVDGMS